MYPHHVLHSLAIAKFIDFVPNTHILDLGTGGGFPHSIGNLFPECQFFVDSIRKKKKKLKVVEHVIEALELQNVKSIIVESKTSKPNMTLWYPEQLQN